MIELNAQKALQTKNGADIAVSIALKAQKDIGTISLVAKAFKESKS